MRKNIIFASRNCVIYNGITYEVDYFLKNIANKRKRNIKILDEDMYINIYSVLDKEDLKIDKINSLIKRKFGNLNDFLINYEISRDKKNIYIYAVRGGGYIERLCTAPVKVNIEPIQISIAKLCNNLIKKKEYVYIFKYRNLYYYIKIKNKHLIESLIISDLEEMKVNFNNINEIIYVDKEIKDEIEGEVINIKERSIYNEKVC